MSVQLLTDEPHGIEWYECDSCGAQGDAEPLGTLASPKEAGLRCCGSSRFTDAREALT